MDGLPWDGRLKQDSFKGFAIAILIFSLASSIFFTPLPIFLNSELQLAPSLVFVAYILNYILMLSLSMELIPAGKSGVFDVLVGLGAAVGSFFGPFLAENLNYLPTFLIAGAV